MVLAAAAVGALLVELAGVALVTELIVVLLVQVQQIAVVEEVAAEQVVLVVQGL